MDAPFRKALCNLLLGRSNAENQNNETKLKIAVWPSNKCTLFFFKIKTKKGFQTLSGKQVTNELVENLITLHITSELVACS